MTTATLNLNQRLKLLLVAGIVSLGFFSFAMVGSVSAAADDPIPPGCPGSMAIGPFTTAQLNVCKKIPAGCLGSTQSGSKSSKTKCPYQALPIPAGCPGSKLAGPPSPADICSKIPAGCPGSSHKGKKKPALACQYSAKAKSTSKPKSTTTPNSGSTTPESVSGKDPAADPNTPCNADNGCDLVAKYINPSVNLLSLAFGLIATGSLILGGIQYSASGGDPQKVAEAKQRISKTLYALAAFLFMWAFLQFLIPGGLFQ